jgi:hypothetical protein
MALITHNVRSFLCDHGLLVMMSNTAIKNLASDCASTNKANGFDVTTYKNLPGKLLFVLDELCREAREAVCSAVDDEHSLEVELADGLIRLLACMCDLYGSDWAERVVTKEVKKFVFASFEKLMGETVHYILLAGECWRHDKRDDVKYSLEIALSELIYVSQCLGIDIVACAQQKCAKNRKRGYLHGKKHSLG